MRIIFGTIAMLVFLGIATVAFFIDKVAEVIFEQINMERS